MYCVCTFMSFPFKSAILFILLSILFYLLFYQQDAGFNVLIYESVLALVMLWQDAARARNNAFRLVLAALLLSALFVALYGSDIAIAVNVMFLFLMTAYRTAPQLRSPLNAFKLGLMQGLRTAADTIVAFSAQDSQKTVRLQKLYYLLRLLILPLLTVVFFLILYSGANSRFSSLLQKVSDTVSRLFSGFFLHISAESAFVLAAGMLLAAAFLFQRPLARLLDRDAAGSDALLRRRRRVKTEFWLPDLKKEYKSMLILLVLLNGLILILNLIDLDWVWLHYRWDGGELREFVHEGTYLLIVAILFSCAIALYIFRNNLNHYGPASLLKKLTYVWIAQNMFMVLSVAMRTRRYIEHFNLAHLRIGLLYFLLAALVFMVFILIKIRYTRSSFYLIRQTGRAVLIIVWMLCPFNWDSIIARYNFRHAGTAYLHKDWMLTLSDKTLPVLGKHLDLLDGPIGSESRHNGVAPDYKTLYRQRVDTFVMQYQSKHWLSLNYAEMRAYRQLKH